VTSETHEILVFFYETNCKLCIKWQQQVVQVSRLLHLERDIVVAQINLSKNEFSPGTILPKNTPTIRYYATG